MTAPIQIGMSLNPLYLTRQPGDVDQQWFGPPREFLRDIAREGVTHIELRAITPSTPVAVAESALHEVWENGFEPTLHGTLPSADDHWTQKVAPLIHLLRMIARRSGHVFCPITMHARAADSGDIALLADETVEVLSRTARWLKTEGLPGDVAVEINRAKKKVDPSFTYDGVLSMRQRADNAAGPVGITWDMGHTYSNILTDHLPENPPQNFVEAVIHTHIHDLGPTGKTHWPLTEGRVPLQRFVTSLARAGYRHVWNLELEPARYATEPDIRQRVIRSIGLLRQAVEIGMRS